jgi:hypothetical protein
VRAIHLGRAGVGLRGGAVRLGVSPAWGRRGGGDDRRAPPVGRSCAGAWVAATMGQKAELGRLAGWRRRAASWAARRWAAGASGAC